MTGTNQKNRSLVRFQSIPHSPVNNHHLVLFNVKSSQFYLHSTKSQIFLNGLFNLHSTQHLRSSVLIRKNSPQKCLMGGKKGKKPQPNGSILKIQTSDPFFCLKFVLYPLFVCRHLSMYSLLQLFFFCRSIRESVSVLCTAWSGVTVPSAGWALVCFMLCSWFKQLKISVTHTQ